VNSPLTHKIAGLYAITPDGLTTNGLLSCSRLVLQGGARVLQYRNKVANDALKFEQASALRLLTKEFGAQLIINDEVALAVKVDADGVHLGATDGEILLARAQLGADKLIGASCYNRFDLAQMAATQGADYIAFGAFFSTEIKPNAPQADIALLRQARAKLNLPVVAIGGITAQNGVALIEAGADALAVISAVFSAPDIELAAQEFSNLFN
jgi:thiamine-phosphate pyrophosphorylase